MEWWTPQSSPPPGTGPGAGWGMSATLLLVFGWDSAKQELVKASDHQGIVFSDVMRPDWAARLRDERLKTTSLFRSGESWQWWGMWCSRRWQKTEIRMGFVYLKKKKTKRELIASTATQLSGFVHHGHSTSILSEGHWTSGFCPTQPSLWPVFRWLWH